MYNALGITAKYAYARFKTRGTTRDDFGGVDLGGRIIGC